GTDTTGETNETTIDHCRGGIAAFPTIGRERRNPAPGIGRRQRSVSRAPSGLREGERPHRERRVVEYDGYPETGRRWRTRRSRHSRQQRHRSADQGWEARSEHPYG